MGIILMQENGRFMQTSTCTSDNKPARISLPEDLRNFHKHLPLAGDPPNALLSLPDDLLIYLIAAIRNTPRSPPDLSVEEWHNFFDLLRPHWIVPLLAFHLRTWTEEFRPPQKIMEYLDGIFLAASARNLLVGRQIQSITTALEEADIPVILMKGHALARTVYPDPALRQSSDIDLLVARADMLRAEAVMNNLGYTCDSHTFHIALHEHPHQVFHPRGNGLHVELHWDVDGNYKLFEENWITQAFENKIPVRSPELCCYTFDPVHQLQFLACHNIFQHHSLRLDWVYDAARLIEQIRSPHDWEMIRTVSAPNHIRIPLELALVSARLWSGFDIPAPYDDFATWPAASEREHRLWRHAQVRHRNLMSDQYLILQSIPGTAEKLKYCFRFLLPPAELLNAHRRSSSPADIPVAHLRRWLSIVRYG